MADHTLDEALDALNTARAYLSPGAADIYIGGDNEIVGVDWLTDAPDGPLRDFLVSVESACEVVTRAMGELFLTEDHRGRWVLLPNA
jgi:hypothetical protein